MTEQECTDELSAVRTPGSSRESSVFHRLVWVGVRICPKYWEVVSKEAL